MKHHLGYLAVVILLITTVLSAEATPELEDSDDVIIPVIIDVIAALVNGPPVTSGNPCLVPNDDVTSGNLVKRMLPKKLYQLARLRTAVTNANEQAQIRAKLLQRDTLYLVPRVALRQTVPEHLMMRFTISTSGIKMAYSGRSRSTAITSWRFESNSCLCLSEVSQRCLVWTAIGQMCLGLTAGGNSYNPQMGDN
ncbi:hypothetical protein LSH36_678g01013 [Paralvinella palmiformis]|uniref:Uncharacterized protein n=1 Tax=Paralvinella palmiformis TaxID=53620 RepID=A0AAD9J2J0_9ANNE|nr:hypothetical protein LSH36_678g01013 [Paralvinella palmiformis]